MKKFKWRLQCVLDTKNVEERNKKGEISALNRAISEKQDEILQCKLKLKKSIDDLKKLEAKKRIPKQQVLINYADSSNKYIKYLENELQELQEKKKRKIEELAELKQYKETLEKLKEKAKQEYQNEIAMAEQKEIDEYVARTYARDVILNSKDSSDFDYF